MNFRYIKFIVFNVFKKKSVIIFAALYLFCLLSFLILVPVLTSMDVLNLWSNTTFAIAQTYLLFICAIFCGIVASYIFRESAEDGTELIIVSKPISRIKIIFSKFMAFFIISIFVALMCEIVVLMCIFVPQMQKDYMLDLALSVFIGNMVIFMVFGSIAILLAICFNKVIVILINTGIVLIMFVFQILTLIVFDSPLTITLKNGVAPNSITTYKKDENGNNVEKQFVAFNLLSDKINPEIAKYFQTQDGVKQYWNEFVSSKDKSNIAGAFDFAAQLGKTFNSVGLVDYSKLQATRLFGISSAYKYILKNSVITDANTQNGIDMLYSGPRVNGYPKYVSVFGVPQNDIGILLGKYNENMIPVGSVYESPYHKTTYVYFDAQDNEKYSDGFNAIYKYLFNPYYYKYDDQLAHKDYDLWRATNSNLAIFYDLLAMALANPESTKVIAGLDNQPTLPSTASDKTNIKSWFKDSKTPIDNLYFNINSAFDLNFRIVQFQYWSFSQLVKDQQIIFDMFKQQAHIIDFDPSKEESWKGFFNFSTHIDNTWYKYDDVSWLGPNATINTTNLTLMDIYYKISSILSGFTYYDTANGYYSIERDINNIPTSFVRNALVNYTPNIFRDAMKPSILAPLITNLYFWYDVEDKNLPYVYVLIWLTISVVIFTAGIVVYSKHDIK